MQKGPLADSTNTRRWKSIIVRSIIQRSNRKRMKNWWTP